METGNRVRFVTTDPPPILIIDYSDLKEDQMIEVLMNSAEVVKEHNKPVMVVSIFNDRCFVTSKFMRQVEQNTSKLQHLLWKQSVVGLSPVKKLILKGYNFMFNFDIQNFDTKEEAIKYLLTKSGSLVNNN